MIPKKLRSQAASLRRALVAKIEPFQSPTRIPYERLAIPTTRICVETNIIRYTPDFLPDWYTLAGSLFEKSPHVDFANRYYTDAAFNPIRTPYFRQSARGRVSPTSGEKGAMAKCERFVQLLDQLRHEGYLPDKYGPVMMARCVDGSYFVINGKHRLAGLMALGHSDVDVSLCYCNEVRALFQSVADAAQPGMYYRKSRKLLESCGTPLQSRSNEIAELRRDIKKWQLETWADIYHPIPFYEFRDLSTQVKPETPYQRLGMILEQYPSVEGMRVLDVGCNVGFFSLSLARRGAFVTGLDIRKEYVEIANRVSEIYSVPLTVIQSEVNANVILEQEPVDLAICFSVLQWIAKTSGFDEAVRVLGALSERAANLCFDVAVNSGKACFTCDAGDELNFVRDLLQRSTAYKEIVHVGDVHPYGSDIRHVFFCRREPGAKSG